MAKLDALYFELFRQEEQGNQERVEELRRAIKRSLLEMEQERALDPFIHKMRKKPFVKTINECIAGEMEDSLELAVALSSMLTHSLLEMKADEQMYFTLDIQRQMGDIARLLGGEANVESIREGLVERISPFERGNA